MIHLIKMAPYLTVIVIAIVCYVFDLDYTTIILTYIACLLGVIRIDAALKDINPDKQ